MCIFGTDYQHQNIPLDFKAINVLGLFEVKIRCLPQKGIPNVGA